MQNTSKYKKVYIGNRKEKYIAPKVIEFNKVRPYYKKVKFDQTREEKKIKFSIIVTITLGILFIYLGLMFFGTKDDSEEFVKVDTGIEQTVNDKEEADELLGFKTIAINNLPGNFVQNYIKVDPINKIFKTHYTVQGENKLQTKNVILLQKQTTLTPIVATIDGNNAEYSTFNGDNDDISTYLNSFDNNANINLVKWHDGNFEFIVVGDLGIEGLSKFISDVLEKEISFSISNKK